MSRRSVLLLEPAVWSDAGWGRCIRTQSSGAAAGQMDTARVPHWARLSTRTLPSSYPQRQQNHRKSPSFASNEFFLMHGKNH